MFKVGDKVRVIKQVRGRKIGDVLIIKSVPSYISHTFGQLYVVEDNGNGVYEVEVELVTPERRLYRAGDKVLVEYTVRCDEELSQQAKLYGRLPVEAPGLGGKRYLNREMLDAGILTPAPEKLYVPKVGDTFTCNIIHGNLECLYADAESIFVRCNGSRRTWFNIKDTDYNFTKTSGN